MEEKLFISTFGGFSMKYGDCVITDQDNRSKKLWGLLEYLAAFHANNVPQSCLVDLLWNEDSITQDPENALKTALHRTRRLWDSLNLPNPNLIIHKQQTFSWNNSIECCFDFDEFFNLYSLASSSTVPNEQKMEYYKTAWSLYSGPFLPKLSTEDWASNLATHYERIYLKMMEQFMELLAAQERYEEITSYCAPAAALYPKEEVINYYLILGLYKSGNRTKAIEQYKRVINTYYDEFGVEPPSKFLALYNEITTHEKGVEADLTAIQEKLIERDVISRAYECDYSVFTHLYHIQARTCARNGISVFLCLLTVRGHRHTELSTDLLKKAMDKLSTVIATSTRNSDVFSRYSKNQYIVMLPTACYENSLMIGERILKNFDKTKPKTDVDISYAVKYLEPKLFT